MANLKDLVVQGPSRLIGDTQGTKFIVDGGTSSQALMGDGSLATISSATQINTALAGKSNTGHTHDDRYYTEAELTGSSTTVVVAKASSATTAASAAKLSNTSAIGSGTQPVFFTANGVPSATTYSLSKSVPSNAVFTDTATTLSGHYTITATTADTKSANASSTSELSWGSSVVTGVTLSGDAKGHITAVSVASGKLKTPVTGVTLASGTNNGTVKLTVNGSATDNIAVKGLGTAAYMNTGTTSDTVARGDHNHDTVYVNTATTVSTASGLTGGGNLSANRTLGLAAVTVAGYTGSSVTSNTVSYDAYGRISSAASIIYSAVTVSSSLTNITCPSDITGTSKSGSQAIVIYHNGGSTTDYDISISTTNIISPSGEQVNLICPKNGYCEINFLNIGGTIFVRGV